MRCRILVNIQVALKTVGPDVSAGRALLPSRRGEARLQLGGGSVRANAARLPQDIPRGLREAQARGQVGMKQPDDSHSSATTNSFLKALHLL